MDATYRSDLRELNELNFARFDAKLEQRVDALEHRMDVFEARMEQRFAVFEARMEQRFAEFEARMERRFGEQARWMFAAWASLLIPIIGLWIRG